MTVEPRIALVTLRAGGADSPARAAFADRARSAAAAVPGAAVLVTCHRVEVVGMGQAGDALSLLARSTSGASMASGREAVRHVLRLAAGLESAVLGEDEILHQVRDLLETVRQNPRPDSGLVRLLEMAIGVGRRARGGADRPQERSLADRALRMLVQCGVEPSRSELLVVGSGVMGRALAVAASRRGARVAVASRSIERARTVASVVGGRPLSLAEAALRTQAADAVLVALGGPWQEIDGIDATHLPVVVDLSSPPAVPPVVASALGPRFVGVDELAHEDADPPTGSRAARDAYVRRAESLVDEALERYMTWAAARGSVAALRDLRARAEEARAAELARLLRRLPSLDARERELVEAFSEQLIAAVLHRPTAHLHEDADGSAAAAARRLFDL